MGDVHRNSVWIRNQLDVTFVLSFISPLQVAQHVSDNYVPWLQEASCSHGTIPTRGNNTMQSSAPEDGYTVVRNMLSNL